MAMDDYDDFDDTFDDDEGVEEESNNRTFLLAAGGFGFLVLCALLAVGAYVFFNFNAGQNNTATAQALATIQEATVVTGLTQAAATQQQQAAEISATVPPTDTPVVAEATITPTETPNPATATVGAAVTQIAASTETIIPTSTALPNTGFADDVGLPGMFALALALIVVIFLVRRLRAAPTR